METVSDELGATMPWLGRTRYLRGWVVFTCHNNNDIIIYNIYIILSLERSMMTSYNGPCNTPETDSNLYSTEKKSFLTLKAKFSLVCPG